MVKFAGLPGNAGETSTYLLPNTVTYYRGLLVTEWSDLRSLENLSHLQVLSLFATNWDGALANQPYIHLPALTRMYIELDMFGPNAVGPIFEYIKAPRLETLTIFADNQLDWGGLLSSGERTPTLSTVNTLHLMSPDITSAGSIYASSVLSTVSFYLAKPLHLVTIRFLHVALAYHDEGTINHTTVNVQRSESLFSITYR